MKEMMQGICSRIVTAMEINPYDFRTLYYTMFSDYPESRGSATASVIHLYNEGYLNTYNVACLMACVNKYFDAEDRGEV